MSANDDQVGGSHYQQTSYQHWDLVVLTRMDYLAGNATKYLSRWRRKNGAEDLLKALHYTKKLIEVSPLRRVLTDRVGILEQVGFFVAANRMSPLERDAIVRLASWQSTVELVEARDIILKLLQLSGDEGPMAKPVPLTEETNHGERAPPLDPNNN